MITKDQADTLKKLIANDEIFLSILYINSLTEQEPAATVPPSRGESVLVELTYHSENIYGTSVFYNENTNRVIHIDQPRIVKPSVTISVLGGVAEIEDRHPSVEVTIHDYDNEEE